MEFVFKTRDVRRYRFPTHTNDLILDRKDASRSEVFIVVLEPGESPPLHRHDDTEQIFFVLEGEGRLRVGDEVREFRVEAGDVVRIPPSTLHTVEAVGPQSMRYLAVDCFLGRPEEATWDEHVKAICQTNGWSFREILGG